LALINLTADETVTQTIAQSQEIPLLGKFIIPSAMTTLQLRSWMYCSNFYDFSHLLLRTNVADQEPGSETFFRPLDWIRDNLSLFRIPDPTHISKSLVTIFGFRTIDSNFFLFCSQYFKI
jgi:hypothetical protein